MDRPGINEESIEKSMQLLKDKLNYRLKEKGNGGFVSTHEIYGILAEEHHELIDSLIDNDHEQFKSELLDIGVACLFGVACIDQGVIDW